MKTLKLIAAVFAALLILTPTADAGRRSRGSCSGGGCSGGSCNATTDVSYAPIESTAAPVTTTVGLRPSPRAVRPSRPP